MQVPIAHVIENADQGSVRVTMAGLTEEVVPILFAVVDGLVTITVDSESVPRFATPNMGDQVKVRFNTQDGRHFKFNSLVTKPTGTEEVARRNDEFVTFSLGMPTHLSERHRTARTPLRLLPRPRNVVDGHVTRSTPGPEPQHQGLVFVVLLLLLLAGAYLVMH